MAEQNEQVAQKPRQRFAEWFDSTWVGRNIMPAMYALTRQGAKEVAQVLPAFPDSVKPVEELGTLGNPTQFSVNQENGVTGLYHQDAAYKEWLKEKGKEITKPAEDRGMDREM